MSDVAHVASRRAAALAAARAAAYPVTAYRGPHEPVREGCAERARASQRECCLISAASVLLCDLREHLVHLAVVGLEGHPVDGHLAVGEDAVDRARRLRASASTP